MITVFGYGAPSTDTEAMKLFKYAWGELDNRQLEEFQFINIEDEETCLKKWGQFVHSHHYRYNKDFFDSYIALFPRRSDLVEMLTHNFNICHRTDKGYQKNMSYDDISKFLQPLINEEESEQRITTRLYT